MRRRTPTRAGAICALTAALTLAGPAEAAKVARNGRATVVSVDGPARLTVKTAKGQKLRVRLYAVDAPEVGECGAAESTAALASLTRRDRGRLRYSLVERANGTFERSSEGRLLASLAPRKGGYESFYDGIAGDLLEREWARAGDMLKTGQGPISHGESMYGYGEEPVGPRPARGLWVACGGRTHLPLGEPAPAHAPAPWTITPSGITTSIGPLALPAKLAPGATLTVAAVAAIAAVEFVDFGETCEGRVPSLEIVLIALTPTSDLPCSRAEVHTIATDGPGSPPTTTSGLAVGQRGDQLPKLFPRISGLDGPVCDEEGVALSGPQLRPWAWQTEVELHYKSCVIERLTTAVSPRED